MVQPLIDTSAMERRKEKIEGLLQRLRKATLQRRLGIGAREGPSVDVYPGPGASGYQFNP